tara:strand:- start:691 stop:1341 length:651 start_codon:yes stop_codon:yes gene_type:complete
MISKNLKKRIFTSLILFFLAGLVIINYTILVYISIVLGVMSIIEFVNLSKNILQNYIYKFVINSLFISYVLLFFSLFIFYSSFTQFKIILFILLFGCVASDLGGYIFGKILKGPKLTKISPKKTISGSIGSFIFSIILVSSLIFYFTNQFSFKTILIGFFTSFACQSGDIFFSYLKRKAKFKDTGNLLPGHGGILDRLDGIYFGIPVGFVTLILVY